MRTLEETRADLRTLQAKCLDRGFYQGRRFEAKSTSHGAKQTSQGSWAQAEEEAQIESSAALDRLLRTITELYDVVDEMGGDLL